MPGLLLPFVAAASLSQGDTAAIDSTVAGLFAPYRQEEMTSEAVWERPIFSREVTQLIEKWRGVIPEDEPDDLNDGDWLCQCQDWDPKRFRVKILSRKVVEPDLAEVEVDIDIGFGEVRDAFLQFRREEGKWKLDELYSEPYPDGIRQALCDTIKADEALRGGEN